MGALSPLGARGGVNSPLGTSFVSGFTPSDVTQEEADALIALYDATAGDSWTDNTGWKTDPDVGDWYGVTVSGGHVTQIQLQNNNVADFSVPWDGSDLSYTTLLRLDGNSISDISSVTWPDNLIYLHLFRNSISDISSVTWPNSITTLRLDGNSISDILSVTWPDSIDTLYLYDNSISDISSVTWPDSLIRLYLYSNSISDISGVTWPNSITDLRLYDNSISDISSVTWPDTLKHLYLFGNSISDISGVTWPDSLITLRLDDNSISDISDISGVTWPDTLKYLHLFGNSISDISGITWPDSLATLRLDNNSMSETNVDLVLEQIYNQRSGFTYASPILYIHGTNSAPSGTYQDGDPPTTGKEYIYELENDPESEGFSTWSITYNT
jgi:hypothetical protein